MNQFSVLLMKEWRENVRNFKVLWIPLVFIFFGVSEPLTNYYLPEILNSVGNMPEGTEFTFPELTADKVLTSTVGQFQVMGILVLLLAYMGSLAKERTNGTGTLLYVRPLSYTSYFLSKWVMGSFVALGSVWLGLIASWYYINLLFDSIGIGEFFAFTSTYSVWILLVMSLLFAASAWLPTGGAAGLSIGIVFIGQIIDSLVGTYWSYTPFKLVNYASEWLADGPDATKFGWTMAITIILIVLFIVLGIWMAKRNAAKAKV